MQEKRVTYAGCAEQGAPAEVALRLPPAVPHGGAAAATVGAPFCCFTSGAVVKDRGENKESKKGEGREEAGTRE